MRWAGRAAPGAPSRRPGPPTRAAFGRRHSGCRTHGRASRPDSHQPRRLRPWWLPQRGDCSCGPCPAALARAASPAPLPRDSGVESAWPGRWRGLPGGGLGSGAPGPVLTHAAVPRTQGRCRFQPRQGWGELAPRTVGPVFTFHPHPCSHPHPSPISVVPEKEAPRFCFMKTRIGKLGSSSSQLGRPRPWARHKTPEPGSLHFQSGHE